MKLAGDDERHAIFGMTGSGKTVFGLWTLSHRSFHRKPWIVVDSKRDPLIARIPGIQEIPLDAKPPKHRGLYVLRPDPADFDAGLVTAWLYDVWRRENTGLFIDEGYSFKQHNPALRAVLTQGRSKQIPVIALSQRPSWVSPFLLSESEQKSVFFLQHPADAERVREWLPDCDPLSLPPHHFYWYSMKTREFHHCGPCPDEEAVLDIFDGRRVRRSIF